MPPRINPENVPIKREIQTPSGPRKDPIIASISISPTPKPFFFVKYLNSVAVNHKETYPINAPQKLSKNEMFIIFKVAHKNPSGMSHIVAH